MARKPKLECGDVIAGRYRIDRVIGKGGFGAVYEASTANGQRVALKVMHQKLTTSDTDQRRFQRESSMVQNLQHPNIVRLLDFGETDTGLPFIAFELLRGRALEQVVKSIGAMPWPRVAQVACDVLQALGTAHAVGIVHRDIKPANVFLCEGEGGMVNTKVLDFGIAKSLSPDAGKATQLTETGQMLGTPYYMAPEQVRGLPVGPTVDLYALGLVMAEMLAGHRAIGGDSVIEVYMAQISDSPLPFKPIVEQSPLGPIIRRATAKPVASRFQSAAEMYEAIQMTFRAAPAEAYNARHIPLGSTIGPDDDLAGVTGALFLSVSQEAVPESVTDPFDRGVQSHPPAASGPLAGRPEIANLKPSEQSMSDSFETRVFTPGTPAPSPAMHSGAGPSSGSGSPMATGGTAIYQPAAMAAQSAARDAERAAGRPAGYQPSGRSPYPGEARPGYGGAAAPGRPATAPVIARAPEVGYVPRSQARPFNPDRTLDDHAEATLDDVPSVLSAVPLVKRVGTMPMAAKPQQPEPAQDPLASTVHMGEAEAQAYHARHMDAARASYISGVQPSPLYDPSSSRISHAPSGLIPSPMHQPSAPPESARPPIAAPARGGVPMYAIVLVALAFVGIAVAVFFAVR